jgi:hypothetical protein
MQRKERIRFPPNVVTTKRAKEKEKNNHHLSTAIWCGQTVVSVGDRQKNVFEI